MLEKLEERWSAKLKNTSAAWRMKTHARNNIAVHHMSTKHQMNWEEATCLDFAANYHERMFLESWYTKSDNNSIINICRDMPGAYYSSIVRERARADSREQTRELSADASQ